MQNPHWEGKLKDYVPRKALKRLLSFLPLRQVVTISGIRRCGKSTLARMAIRHLIEEAGVDPKNILFVNLEQPEFLEYRHDPSYLGTIFDSYLRLVAPQGRIYCFFDEIQFFENWQVYIKSRYENDAVKFVLTGSNSSLLSNDLNTLLSGRALGIELEPFDFGEYLDYLEIPHRGRMERLANRIAIERARGEFLLWGGFYEVFSQPDPSIRREILQSYARNILYQDIVPRYRIRNGEILERLFFYLLSHPGSLLNYTALAEAFEISDKSVKEYLGYLEEAFLLRRLDRFHPKARERIRSPKKIYARDNGFLRIAPTRSEDRGRMLENRVFLDLYALDPRVAYLRERYEVDFYTEHRLIQVAWSLDDPKTRQRELRAFEAFESDRTREEYLVTFETEKKAGKVSIVPYDRFALEVLPRWEEEAAASGGEELLSEL
jgi:predicted AAA+ superfamily ATPase